MSSPAQDESKVFEIEDLHDYTRESAEIFKRDFVITHDRMFGKHDMKVSRLLVTYKRRRKRGYFGLHVRTCV